MKEKLRAVKLIRPFEELIDIQLVHVFFLGLGIHNKRQLVANRHVSLIIGRILHVIQRDHQILMKTLLISVCCCSCRQEGKRFLPLLRFQFDFLIHQPSSSYHLPSDQLVDPLAFAPEEASFATGI